MSLKESCDSFQGRGGGEQWALAMASGRKCKWRVNKILSWQRAGETPPG